jgi:rhodanese-related sulfurtransferase
MDATMDDLQIEPRDVKQRLERGENVLLLDVREQWEYDICNIAGAKLVPLRTLPANMALFEAAESIVVYCHHGMRSLDAAAWLRSQGIENARSMTGGIERWSAEIDPAVPRY